MSNPDKPYVFWNPCTLLNFSLHYLILVCNLQHVGSNKDYCYKNNEVEDRLKQEQNETGKTRGNWYTELVQGQSWNRLEQRKTDLRIR